MKNTRLKNLSKKVLDSELFKKAQKEAQSYLSDEKKMKELLGKAETKSEKVQTDKLTFLNKIKVLMRMLKSYIKGDYRVMPWQSLIFITAGIIYFISPFDFLPDFIPFLGFTDDVSIILFIFNSLNPDIQKFLEWEAGKENEITEDAIVAAD